MAVHVFGNPLVSRLISALGLKPNETLKVVIVIDPDDVVKVYAVLIPGAEDVRRLAEEIEGIKILPVADVIVEDDGTVITTPLPQQP